MSLILDALNRADQERSVENNTPGIQSAHYSAPANEHSLRRWIIEGLVVVVIIFGFYLYSQLDTPATTAIDPNNNTVPSSSQPVSSPPIAVIPAASPAAGHDAAKVIESSPVNPVNANPGIAPVPEPPSASTNAAIDSLYQRQSAATAAITKPAAKTAKAATPAPTPPSDADKTLSILASIPLLSQQSVSFQRRIPSIEYSVHAYAEGGGFVMLNGKRYRVGDMLQPQLRVIAILPDSLVLDFQQRQFRLMALNSWINI